MKFHAFAQVSKKLFMFKVTAGRIPVILQKLYFYCSMITCNCNVFRVWNNVLLFVLGFSPLGKPCKTPVANSAGRPIAVLINVISDSFCYNAIHSFIKLQSAVPILKLSVNADKSRENCLFYFREIKLAEN